MRKLLMDEWRAELDAFTQAHPDHHLLALLRALNRVLHMESPSPRPSVSSMSPPLSGSLYGGIPRGATKARLLPPLEGDSEDER